MSVLDDLFRMQHSPQRQQRFSHTGKSKAIKKQVLLLCANLPIVVAAKLHAPTIDVEG